MMAIYVLAKEFHSTFVAVLYALTMIAPCLSLVMLFVINQKATSFLRMRGIKVGFMGADPENI